jgi:hypothetical protein
MKGASFGQPPALPTNIRQGWKGLPLARDKHSILLRKSVNYGQKSFITLGADYSSEMINIFGAKL